MRSVCLIIILAALTLTGGCHAKDRSRQSTDADPNVRTDSMPETIPAPPDPPSSPSATAPDTRPLLVCFGDSLTAGYGTEAGQSYPDFLQADLDQKGYHYRVVNEGVSGATSKDGVARLSEMLALKPAAVVVEFGGNDGLRGLPVDEMRSNLDTIVRRLKASGTKVMLAGITLPPDYGPDYVNQFTASYALVAKKYQVPLFPFLLKGVFGVDGMMQADRTHATAMGNEIVARNVLPMAMSLLQR